MASLGSHGFPAPKQGSPQSSAKRKEPVGLLSVSGSSVPLQSVHVDVKVIDFLAEVTMRQTYINSGSSAIQAKYVFPLDSNGEPARRKVVGVLAFSPRRLVVQAASTACALRSEEKSWKAA